MRRFHLSRSPPSAARARLARRTAAQITAATTVNVVKPAQLMKLQDMDFGTLTFGGFTGMRTIALSQAGALTCAADLVCSGAAKQARFNVQGSNKMTAMITVTGGTLSNGTDTIPFTPDAPASVYLPNSGAPGIDFDVGGSLTRQPTLVGGDLHRDDHRHRRISIAATSDSHDGRAHPRPFFCARAAAIAGRG